MIKVGVFGGRFRPGNVLAFGPHLVGSFVLFRGASYKDDKATRCCGGGGADGQRAKEPSVDK